MLLDTPTHKHDFQLILVCTCSSGLQLIWSHGFLQKGYDLPSSLHWFAPFPFELNDVTLNFLSAYKLGCYEDNRLKKNVFINYLVNNYLLLHQSANYQF